MSATVTKTPTPTGLPAADLQPHPRRGLRPRRLVRLRPARRRWRRDEGGGLQAAREGPAQHRRGRPASRLLGGADHGEADRRTGGAVSARGRGLVRAQDESRLSWKEIAATLDAAQQRLSQAVSEIASGARISPLGEAERFDLVVGITGHAAYHAGQIQLIKKLIGA